VGDVPHLWVSDPVQNHSLPGTYRPRQECCTGETVQCVEWETFVDEAMFVDVGYIDAVKAQSAHAVGNRLSPASAILRFLAAVYR
jgi:hypothetical protein